MEVIKQTLEKQKRDDEGGKFGVQINIYGAKGSGKTYRAREILKQCYKKPVVYRMSNDFDDLDVALFKPNNLYEDLEDFLKWAIEQGKKKKIDCIVFDEADRLFKNKKSLSTTMTDLLDMHRHYFLSLIFITRRPTSMSTEIAEVGHFQIVYAIEGNNAFKTFNNIRSGFGDLVKELVYKSYDCVFKELGKEPVILRKGEM